MANKKKRSKKARGGFRRRARSVARSVGRQVRSRLRRVRRPQLGLLGKTGVAVAGGIPVAWSATEALVPWMHPGYAPVSAVGKLKISMARFVNSLSIGFGLGPTFSGTVEGSPMDAYNNYAPGAWVKTTTVGISFVITDFVTGALFKITGKGVPRTKIMGKQLLSG